MPNELLSINNLTVTAQLDRQTKTIVEDVSLVVEEQSIVGLVGASGSGKTTTGYAIIRLLANNLRLSSGKIFFAGQNIVLLKGEQMRTLRGSKIRMVLQEPLNAFNPVFSIGYQI